MTLVVEPWFFLVATGAKNGLVFALVVGLLYVKDEDDEVVDDEEEVLNASGSWVTGTLKKYLCWEVVLKG